jgi:hypothetical protein
MEWHGNDKVDDDPEEHDKDEGDDKKQDEEEKEEEDEEENKDKDDGKEPGMIGQGNMVNTLADEIDTMVDNQPMLLPEKCEEMREHTPRPQPQASAPRPQPSERHP